MNLQFCARPSVLFLIAAGLCAVSEPAMGQRGRRGPGGPGGPGGGPNAPDKLLVEKYDLDKDGRLNAEERVEARKEVATSGNGRRRGPRRGTPREPGKPGEKLQPKDVESFSHRGVFDQGVLRTIFLNFESEGWEAELADFKATDVLVPADLTVDGQAYPQVGVSFRGASSFFMIPAGLKRSLNISFDFVDGDQRFGEVKTLNLLNCNGDDSMMSSMLYSNVARTRMAAPRANFVRVVINGESWGIYCNVEQFNKDFLKRNFGSAKGARWKVSGSPNGDGGLRYLGEEVAPYKERFDLKSKEDPEAWKALIHLCKVLDETAPADLAEALDPLLDIDSVLWFLAVDVALLNSDGYWTRASDFSIFLDTDGRFHIVPHDMNEAFQEPHGGPGGPGGRRRGPRGGGPPPFGGPPEGPPPVGDEGDGEGPPPRDEEGRRGQGRGGPGGASAGAGMKLDPLVGLEDAGKPLRSKLLANPEFKTRYLQHVKHIARDLLAWEALAPQVSRTRSLLSDAVAKDTRKLATTEAFLLSTSPDPVGEEEASIRKFAEERAAFLLGHSAIQALPEEVVELAQKIEEGDSVVSAQWPRVDSPLQITEIMAVEMEDAAGIQERSTDWIEIHNTGKEALDLTDHFLTDNPNSPRKWAFPKGLTLPAGQYLLVWADKSKQPGLHANFKLSKKGEHLLLTHKESVLSELEYPRQTRGKSYGPLEGSTGYLQPTPGAANRAVGGQ
ncbi:MAG: CotH kinase family protein [Planctomycetota bacterium]|nr:CotH kinase family protein [Planctomycetota bacterium]